jgi:trk system potassium uptake protein TrkA
MKVVIAGAGDVGFQIAKQLIDERKDVVIIERDQKTAKHAANYLDCFVIQGEGNNIDVLRNAGVDGADFFISVTNSDEVNMISCGLVASEFSVPSKIARVRNIDYSKTRVTSSPFLGIDHIVNPEIEASKVIIRAIEHGAMSDVFLFERTKFQMRSISVTNGSPLTDRSLSDINRNFSVDFLVAFILRNNSYIIPSGDTVIQDNDTVYIVAEEQNLETLFVKTGIHRVNLNRIVIAGGGRIGSYVADHLLRKQNRDMRFFSRVSKTLFHQWRQNIVIVERDKEKCMTLSERFPNALILNEDIADEGVHEEGQFSDYDLIVAATDNQELNVISAIYAKSIGIKRAIAVVNRNSYRNIASSIGIDVTVSQKISMVNAILRLVRRGNIRNIYSFSDGWIEVIELSVDNENISGSKIQDIRLPSQTLIVTLTRNDHTILPDGNSTVQKGDYLVLIARKESIGRIESIFSGE